MHITDDQGRTRISQLQLFSERTGKPHADLTPPEFSPALRYLWRWYDELSSQRRGLEPLGHTEIDAWARLTQRHPARWEVSVLRRMDRHELNAVAEHQNQLIPKGKPNDRHRAARR
ncbi:MAG TPA: hypothetical protein VNV16_11560 [Methylibium sp.]|nr:hypothetical protein [Methylibium sp.]